MVSTDLRDLESFALLLTIPQLIIFFDLGKFQVFFSISMVPDPESIISTPTMLERAVIAIALS